MRRLFKVLTVMVVMISGLSAEGKIFDLKEQYFSGTLVKEGEKKSHKTRYDVEKVEVDTNTKYENEVYHSGSFVVDIKKPYQPNKWNVNITKKVGIYLKGERSSINIISNKGSTCSIVFSSKGVYSSGLIDTKIAIKSKSFIFNGMPNQDFSINIKNIKDGFEVQIGGYESVPIEYKNFGRLSKVEVKLENHNKYNDELSALSIYDAE